MSYVFLSIWCFEEQDRVYMMYRRSFDRVLQIYVCNEFQKVPKRYFLCVMNFINDLCKGKFTIQHFPNLQGKKYDCACQFDSQGLSDFRPVKSCSASRSVVSAVWCVFSMTGSQQKVKACRIVHCDIFVTPFAPTTDDVART